MFDTELQISKDISANLWVRMCARVCVFAEAAGLY